MDTRGKIIKSFFELLKIEPFEKINVRRIMEKSALTRTLFYEYFDGKEDLAKFALEEQLTEIIQYLQSSFDRDMSKQEYHRKVLAGIKVIIEQQPNFRMLLNIQGKSFNLVEEFILEIKANVLKNITSKNPHANPDNLDFYAELFSVSMLTTLQWYFAKKDFPLEKLVDYIQTCVFDGMNEVIDL